LVVSVGRDKLDPVECDIAIQLKKIKISREINIVKKWKERGFLPGLTVAASLCCREGVCGGDSSWLCLWAEINWIPWSVT
jgi:hypothetical protein